MAPTVAWRTAGLCVLCRQCCVCVWGGVTEGNSWSQGIKYSRLKRLVNASSCYYRVLVDKWPSSLQPHARPSMLWLPRTERVILQWTSVNYFLDLLLWERIRSEQLGCLALSTQRLLTCLCVAWLCLAWIFMWNWWISSANLLTAFQPLTFVFTVARLCCLNSNAQGYWGSNEGEKESRTGGKTESVK